MRRKFAVELIYGADGDLLSGSAIIGLAFENDDGSIMIDLRAVPLSGEPLQLTPLPELSETCVKEAAKHIARPAREGDYSRISATGSAFRLHNQLSCAGCGRRGTTARVAPEKFPPPAHGCAPSLPRSRMPMIEDASLSSPSRCLSA